MSASGLDVFDKTLQTTHIWLDALMRDEAIGPDRRVAWHALGAVLRAVRNRVPRFPYALLAMLASCAAGITVVGIDNGYGAACSVLRLLRVGRAV